MTAPGEERTHWPSTEGPVTDKLDRMIGLLETLLTRVDDIEDAVARAAKRTRQVEKRLRELDGEVVKQKHFKKIKKVLDQLEVIEVGAQVPDVGPVDGPESE